MPKGKEQHYVPKFYFRLFSKDGKNILAYYLKSSQSFNTPIDHLCSKPYYYSKNPEIEDSLARLESDQTNVIRNIVQSKNLPKEPQDYVRLISFLAVQHSRTPVAKTKSEQLIENISNEVVDSLVGPDAGVKIVDPMVHLKRILTALNFTALLYDLRPVLLINNTDFDYVCSDNPVIFHNTYFSRARTSASLGYQSPGLQIFCPFSPKIALMMYDQEYYFLPAMNSGYLVTVNSLKDIEQVNSLQLINCHEYLIFSHIGQAENIKRAHERLHNLIGKSKVAMDKIYLKDGDNVREILHSYEYREPYDLDLSFVELNNNADTNKLIRNQEWYEKVSGDVEKAEKEYRSKFQKND